MKKFILLPITLMLFFSCSYHVKPDHEELIKPLPAAPDLRIGALDNQFRYYIRKNSNPKNGIMFQLVVKTGSLHETQEESGVAHFIEHMAFNGTKHFKKNELTALLQSWGQQFGSDFNAYTSYDRTVYRFRIPDNQPETVDKSFVILKDWASEIRFEKEEVDLERKVIIEEWRLYNNELQRNEDKFRSALYNNAIYSERFPIGKRSSIERLQPDQLRNFYSKWYRPENMALVVVGDVNIAKMEMKIKEVFSDLSNTEKNASQLDLSIPPHEDFSYNIISSSQLTDPKIAIYQKAAKDAFQTENDFRNRLIEGLYLTIVNERLQRFDMSTTGIKKARYERCHLTPYDSCHVTRISIKDNRFENGFHEIIREFEKLRRWGVYRSELDRAKKTVMRHVKSEYLERDSVRSEDLFGEIIEACFNDNVVLSIEDRYRLTKKYLRTISLEDLNDLRNIYNTTDNQSIAVYSHTDDLGFIPLKQDVKNLYRSVRFENLEPYEDDVSDLPLFTEQIEKGRVIEEKRHDNVGVISWKLSNGGNVYIKPTQFKKDEVLLGIDAPGGLSIIDKDVYRSMELLSRVLFKSGIGPFTRNDLIKRLIFKNIKGDVYVGNYSHGFYARTSPDDLRVLFQLMHMTLNQPRFVKEVFEEEKKARIEELENNSKSAFWKYRQAIFTQSGLDSEYARMTTADDLEHISFETFNRVAKSLFQNRGEFNLVIVGNVDPGELKKLVESYVASIPVTGKLKRLKDLQARPKPGKKRIEVFENPENRSHIYIMLPTPFGFQTERELEYLSLIQVMQMMIDTKIREELGYVYWSNAGYHFYKGPGPASMLNINVSCAPQNVEPVIKELKNLMVRLKQKPVSNEMINALNKAQRQRFEDRIKNNSFWKNEILTFVSYDQDINKIPGWGEYFQHLTPEMLQASANKYLDEDNQIISILMPKADHKDNPSTGNDHQNIE